MNRFLLGIIVVSLVFLSCTATNRSHKMACAPPAGLDNLRAQHPYARVVMDTLTCNPERITGIGFPIGARSVEDGCLAFIDRNRALFRIRNPYLEFIRDKRYPDELLFQQVLDTVPVIDGYVRFHTVGDSLITSFEGHYFPTPSISTQPIVDTLEAREMAAYMYESDENMDTLKSDMSLAIWHGRHGRPYLAWAVRIEGLDQENWLYLIDAHTGAYLMRREIEPWHKQ